MPTDLSADREALFKHYQPLPDRAVRNRRRLWGYMLLYATLSSAIVAIAVMVGLMFALVMITQGLLAEPVLFLARSGSTVVLVVVAGWAVCFPAFASWYFRLARSPLLSDLLKALSATMVKPGELPQARSALHEAVLAAGAEMPHLALIEDYSANAFVIARTPDQAWVGVTTGLLERLNPDELRAVFAHLVARIRDGSALTNTVIASLFQTVARSGRNGNAPVEGDDYGLAILGLVRIPLVAIATYFVVRACLEIASRVVLLGYRRAHAVTAQSADSEAMLLTKDPKGMLGALEKVLAADNVSKTVHRSPLQDKTLKALLFAWPELDCTYDRELIRIQRMREVLGAAGADHR